MYLILAAKRYNNPADVPATDPDKQSMENNKLKTNSIQPFVGQDILAGKPC